MITKRALMISMVCIVLALIAACTQVRATPVTIVETVVVRETDSLLKVLQNTAHFFRVLGKNNTYLLRDILKNDGDIMEPSFELLHQVIGQGDICRSKGHELGMSL